MAVRLRLDPRAPRARIVLVLPQRPYLPLGTLARRAGLSRAETMHSPRRDRGGARGDRPRRLSATSSTRPPIGPTSCPAASSSGCRSRARCCKSRIGCSSTRRRARSTRRPRPMLYRLLLDRLPDTAIISIGHRSSLVAVPWPLLRAQARGARAPSPGRVRPRDDARRQGRAGSQRRPKLRRQSSDVFDLAAARRVEPVRRVPVVGRHARRSDAPKSCFTMVNFDGTFEFGGKSTIQK